LQFAADVSLPGGGEGAALAWSVDGIEGGNESIGTVTDEGLYTPPGEPQVTLTHTVRATSVALPTVFGEARVTVRSLESFRLALSGGVTVRRGFVDGTIDSAFVLGPGVAVRRGFTDGTTDSKLALGPGVAVRRGFADGTAESKLGLSAGVAVRRGFTDGTTDSRLALGPGVTVGRGASGDPGVTKLALGGGVTVAKGPAVTAVSPAAAARGTAVTLTLSGHNFAGANSLVFLDANGNVDSAVVATNLSVSADGTSLTATLTLQASAAPGARVVVVTTPAGRSATDVNGVNTINVTVQ
jgi:hypothetical protein